MADRDRPKPINFRKAATQLRLPAMCTKHVNDILNKTIVLVLNRNWQAIHVRTPQEAFCMIATNVSAATLNIRWTDCDRNQSLPVVLGGQNPYFNVGIKPRERHCPSCK
jgi:hypothetical protein